MNARYIAAASIFAAIIVVLAGCAGRGGSGSTATSSGTTTNPDTPSVASAITSDDLRSQLIAAAGSDRIFFAYDQAVLSDKAQDTLRQQAAWLISNPNVMVTVEGHCDERGTREYNLGLGERRANASRQYLISLGVNSSRIRTVSYGKERPEAMGSSEEAYAQNRRAVTVVALPSV